MTAKDEYVCQNCGKPLHQSKIVWLELHWEKLTYHIPGTLSEDDSQGCFPFGKDCAKKIVAKGEGGQQ